MVKWIVLLLTALPCVAQLTLKSAMYPALMSKRSGSGGNFAFIVSRTNVNATATTSADTTGGTLIVIALGYDSTTTPVVNDSKNNTYRIVGPAFGSGTRNAMLFCCTNPIVGSGHTFSNNVGRICAMVFSGSAAKAQTSNFVSGTFSTSVQPGSITPATSGQLFVTCVNGDPNSGASATMLVEAGYTQVGFSYYHSTPNNGIAAAYKIKTDAAAENPVWTMNPISVTSASQVTFRPQ